MPLQHNAFEHCLITSSESFLQELMLKWTQICMQHHCKRVNRAQCIKPHLLTISCFNYIKTNVTRSTVLLPMRWKYSCSPSIHFDSYPLSRPAPTAEDIQCIPACKTIYTLYWQKWCSTTPENLHANIGPNRGLLSELHSYYRETKGPVSLK